MIKIMIVEDQTLVREAISALLALQDNIMVVATANHGEQALELLSTNHIDILLTDIEMPRMNGLELIELVQQEFPDVRTMIMTTFSKSGYIKRALNLGAKAFILKESPMDYLRHALNNVMQGQCVIEPELALMALNDTDPLSTKERLVLKLAGDGLSTTAIANELFLSPGTIRNYLSEAISKLNATNRIEAARIAQQKGWL